MVCNSLYVHSLVNTDYDGNALLRKAISPVEGIMYHMITFVSIALIINIIAVIAIIFGIILLGNKLDVIERNVCNTHSIILRFKNTNEDMINRYNTDLKSIKNRLSVLAKVSSIALSKVSTIKETVNNTKTKNEAKNSCTNILVKHKSHKKSNANVKLNIAKNDR